VMQEQGLRPRMAWRNGFRIARLPVAVRKTRDERRRRERDKIAHAFVLIPFLALAAYGADIQLKATPATVGMGY